MPKMVPIIAAGVLAILGGSLIVNSGYRTSSLLLTILKLSDKTFASMLPPALQGIAGLLLNGLSLMIALGGGLVIIGGVVIFFRRIFTAKVLIALGGGIGFLGIVIALAYGVYTGGLGVIADHIEYWIGVLIASIARYVAKYAK